MVFSVVISKVTGEHFGELLTNEILKFYHPDIMGIPPFSFSWFLLGFFKKTTDYIVKKCVYLHTIYAKNVTNIFDVCNRC